jgi:hypothetical protein
MKTLLSLAMLLFSTGAALSADHPTGNYGDGHGQFHSFYQGLFNKMKGVSCCHDKDCRPTQSRMVDDHYEVMINGHWEKVDKDAIIPFSAPDGGAHICAGDPSTVDPNGRVYCVILPPET